MLKVLTLNLHCLEEPDLKKKQETIVKEIIKKDIDIIFLQEVAQYTEEEVIKGSIKKSNYGYDLQKMLSKRRNNYHYNFVPIKYSFGKYDEGLGILSKYEFDDFTSKYISKSTEYTNWKARKAQRVTITVGNQKIDLINSHLGWTDEYEKFGNQLDELVTLIKGNLTIIAGDFNVSPESEEYKYCLSKGFYDVFYSNNPKYLKTPTHAYGMDVHEGENRIDYIFCTKDVTLIDREILFNTEKVSDHYGVYVKIKI